MAPPEFVPIDLIGQLNTLHLSLSEVGGIWWAGRVVVRCARKNQCASNAVSHAIHPLPVKEVFKNLVGTRLYKSSRVLPVDASTRQLPENRR